jgi:hypothetical protein
VRLPTPLWQQRPATVAAAPGGVRWLAEQAAQRETLPLRYEPTTQMAS